VNWTFPYDGIDKSYMEKFLEHPVSSVIPYTPEFWSKAINLGKPVITADSTAPLVNMLENLVWHFSTEPTAPAPAKNAATCGGGLPSGAGKTAPMTSN
jgi:Flp pilus assembly CpaE family ATPase